MVRTIPNAPSRPGNNQPINGHSLQAAIDAVLEKRPVSLDQRASLGYDIKRKKGNEPLTAGEVTLCYKIKRWKHGPIVYFCCVLGSIDLRPVHLLQSLLISECMTVDCPTALYDHSSRNSERRKD